MLARLYRETAALAFPPPDLESVERASRAAAALPQTGGAFGGFFGVGDSSGAAAAQLGYYETLPVVYRCVSLQAAAVSQGLLVLKRQTSKGVIELDGKSRIVELFARVNDVLTFRDLLEYTVISLDLTGNYYWELARESERSPVQEIWPLNPSRMKIIGGPKGVEGYTYEVNNQKIYFAPHEIFHGKYANPNSDWYGLSPLSSVMGTIRSEKLGEKVNEAFLKNGTRLSGFVTMELEADDDQCRIARRQWDDAYGGPLNAGRVAFLAGARDFKPVTLSPTDLRMLEASKFNRDQIMQVLDVWPIIFGIMDTSATRENATVQRKLQHERGTLGRATRIQTQMTERLVPMLGFGKEAEGVFAELDYSHTPIERELAREQAIADSALIDVGAVTINEVREQMGLEPVPYGNTWYGNLSMVPIASAVEEPEKDEPLALPAAPDQAPGRDITVTQETALNGAQIAAATTIVQAVADGRLPRDSALGQLEVFFNLSPEEAAAILGSVGQDFEAAPPQDRPTKGLLTSGNGPAGRAAAYGHEELTVEAKATLPLDVENAAQFEDDDPLVLRAGEIFKRILAENGDAAAADLALDVDFDADTPRIHEWLEKKRVQFADAAFNRYAEDVRAVVRDGLKDGKTIQEIARALDEEVFDGRKANALNVARTEALGTANRGRMDAYAQAGLKEHEWVTSRDAEVRDSHAELDAEVVEIGEEFSNGLKFPGDTDSGDPAEFVNCILPGNAISGKVVAGLKARYAGPVRELKTASGNRLTVTENHPVLTLRGWQPAHSLRKGDVLIGGLTRCELGAALPLLHDNREHPPATIEDVFKALVSQRASAVHVANLDLHGDERHLVGDVQVVRAAGDFQRDVHASAAEFLAGRGGGLRDAVEPLVARLRSGDAGGQRVHAAAAGYPGGLALARDESAVGLHVLPLQHLSLGPAAYVNTALGKASKENASTHPRFVRELLQAGAGLVALDELVEIRDFDYAGHVYDLETADGWMIAGGIVISNCRCSLAAVVPGATRSADRIDAIWRKFSTQLTADERAVGNHFKRMVAEQRRRVREALGVD